MLYWNSLSNWSAEKNKETTYEILACKAFLTLVGDIGGHINYFYGPWGNAH